MNYWSAIIDCDFVKVDRVHAQKKKTKEQQWQKNG